MTETAAFAAWLGAALIVLSDGRRGLALGLAFTTFACAVLAWEVGGGKLAGAAVLLGGGTAVILRLRTGADVWGVMPPGSTPRLVLSIAGGLLALWISTTLMTGSGAQLRFGALSVVGLMAARALTATESSAVLTSLAALALAVAVASGIADTGPGPAPYVVAALIAAGVSALRIAEAHGA